MAETVDTELSDFENEIENVNIIIIWYLIFTQLSAAASFRINRAILL